ncbi:DUF305 domain-containing protein [Embleya sp. AB8]|uniref:DUF305 domain-containing protein n=1 Tax=Embleya sp. AB8 TaxID=3156304 RepID=UPI003C73B38C
MNSQSTRRLRRACVLTSLALAGTLVLTACGNDTKSDRAGNSTPPATTAATASFGDADVMFAQMMIPHHEQAVEMARQAPTKAADPEVKRLAATIEAAQAPEIALMKGWLTAWAKPLAAPMGHDMTGMMSPADMQAFGNATGPDFDRHFLELMIVHHEGAITMARSELTQGTNPEARRLAQAIESSQAEEVNTMRRLLAARTGTTPPPTTPTHH